MINLINGRNGRADLEGSSCRYKCLVNHDGIFDCASTYYSVSQATALALALTSPHRVWPAIDKLPCFLPAPRAEKRSTVL